MTHPTAKLVIDDNLAVLRRMIDDGVKADLVVADPPYNTGGHPDAQQTIHSYPDRRSRDEWLAWIEPRARLIRELLTPTGAAIFAIGRDMMPHLAVLLDEVFGANNRASIVTWSGGTKSNGRLVSNTSDYLLIYTRSSTAIRTEKVRWRTTREGAAEVLEAARAAVAEQPDIASAQRSFRVWQASAGLPDSLRKYRLFDPQGRLYRTTDLGATVTRPSRSKRSLTHPLTGERCPVPPKGWAVSDSTLDALLTGGRIAFGVDHATIPSKTTYLDEIEGTLSDVIVRERGYAQRTLDRMVGTNGDGSTRFYAPKPVDVLQEWISAITAHVECPLIVDAFAGSGTVAEACLRLGIGSLSIEIDQTIAERVAIPRIEAVISGEWVDGSRHDPVAGSLIVERV